MGVRLTDGGMLAGTVRVNTSTALKARPLLRVTFEDLGNNEYNRNTSRLPQRAKCGTF